MTKEKIAKEGYRKFLYFLKENIKVHFKDFDDIFYNGIILSMDKNELTMILIEDYKGTMPILLECVNPDSIREFREKGA